MPQEVRSIGIELRRSTDCFAFVSIASLKAHHHPQECAACRNNKAAEADVSTALLLRQNLTHHSSHLSVIRANAFLPA